MRLHGNGPAQTPIRENNALDAVDAALAMASRSELVTAHEALGLLHGMHAATEAGASAATIDGIITEAAISYSDQVMLDRSQLVNPLLDIRLALCRGQASGSLGQGRDARG